MRPRSRGWAFGTPDMRIVSSVTATRVRAADTGYVESVKAKTGAIPLSLTPEQATRVLRVGGGREKADLKPG